MSAKEAFKEFARAVLGDIARLIARFLALQIIGSFGGGAPGPSKNFIGPQPASGPRSGGPSSFGPSSFGGGGPGPKSGPYSLGGLKDNNQGGTTVNLIMNNQLLDLNGTDTVLWRSKATIKSIFGHYLARDMTFKSDVRNV